MYNHFEDTLLCLHLTPTESIYMRFSVTKLNLPENIKSALLLQ